MDKVTIAIARRAEHLSEVTLAVVGKEIGVCRERVRQIEVEALEKLRLGLLILEEAENGEELLRSLTGMPVTAYRKVLIKLRLQASAA